MKLWYVLVPVFSFAIVLSCGSGKPADNQEENKLSERFKEYWFQGEAEITSYDLEQARYGEVHDGHAVMIFVKEPFSKDKQVKLDNTGEAGDDLIEVMKLNFTKKFNTGIYPYSMMTSTFTPLEGNREVLKVNTTSQEWCGHTFSQLNKKGDKYLFQEFSYFEEEGDQARELENVWLEDELWSLIRLNPEALPGGEIRIIPGQMFQRLKHVGTDPQEATASIEKDGGYSTFTLHYPKLERTLEIDFVTNFPHEIESWEESYVSGWGESAERLTTKATLKRRLMLDYWNKNKKEDSEFRNQLHLRE